MAFKKGKPGGARERREKAEKFQSFNKPKLKITRTAESGEVYIDYKDTESLKKMISGNGKILSRKRTGASAMEQRMLARAVKRARYIALLPFTNVVMKLAVSGAQLREALEQGLSRVERKGGGFLQVSGLRVAYDPRQPAGRRVLGVEVGGMALDPQRSYTAAVVDWVARGSDGVTASAWIKRRRGKRWRSSSTARRSMPRAAARWATAAC